MVDLPLGGSTVTSPELLRTIESKFQYSFFGQRLLSNLPLPGISATAPTEHCDIELCLGIPPRNSTGAIPSGREELTYRSVEINAAGEPALRIWSVAGGEFVHLAYDDGTEFWLDRKRERVWATWTAVSSLEHTVSYLLGPVLGLLLRLRGVTCLHASAVAFGNRCVAFVGATGAGKSTTAAAFARQGHAVLSDDIVALAESADAFRVMPGYPYLCLWPESVKMLDHSLEAMPRMIPEGEKRRLTLGKSDARFEQRRLRLAAIYLLGERRPDPAPYVEIVRPQTALLSLVADTYANKILDRSRRAEEFRVLSRLVETTPIRRVFPHSDSSRIGEFCRVIREDYSELKTPARLRR
jgi:hypothetical protein